MKKGWKKIITGFLAIVLITLLGACGVGNGNGDSEDKTVRLGVVGENNEDWE